MLGQAWVKTSHFLLPRVRASPRSRSSAQHNNYHFNNDCMLSVPCGAQGSGPGPGPVASVCPHALPPVFKAGAMAVLGPRRPRSPGRSRETQGPNKTAGRAKRARSNPCRPRSPGRARQKSGAKMADGIRHAMPPCALFPRPLGVTRGPGEQRV